MIPSLRPLFLFIFLVSAASTFSQSNNSRPEIVGQSPTPLTTPQNQPITIKLSNLIVSDDDPLPVYPDGFTLDVDNGDDYDVDDATVTPDRNFTGTLQVPVRVDDGRNRSKWFDVLIEVLSSNNTVPLITGQEVLTINQGQNFTIELSHLKVQDPDDNYPQDFTLKVFNGNNYSRNGNSITPFSTFTGSLKVPVTVNDGQNESKSFDLKIDVVKAANVAPQITGQESLKTNEEAEITLQLTDLTVTDPDDSYPKDFTLKIAAGQNYTVSGSRITPAKDFSGTLSVAVTVNDGEKDSPSYNVQITVSPINDPPVITGQSPLSTFTDKPITIELNNLTVTDPDDKYPDDFSLKISAGNNYTLSGNTITPRTGFSGELTVKVTVNDGQVNSESFNLKIQVNKISIPEIKGQAELTTNEDEGIKLELSHLTVEGGENTYPNGFKLILANGNNYSVNGTTVTPAKNYFGTLSVSVKVNDGKNDSAPFNLQITVKPVNDVPSITGQVSLKTNKNTSIPIELSYLTVIDPDDKYPDEFTLKISAGVNYSVAGKNVNPLSTFAGQLNVSVSVNDGTANSAAYTMKIDVVPPVNIPPGITGQKDISITQNTQLPLLLGHLYVNDPDNVYPNGFTLKVSPGNNYSVEGTTIRPLPSFANDMLTVSVKVNDGRDDSAPFNLKIKVVPVSATPKINGQDELTMLEDSTMAINLADLDVTDADSPGYPKGFSLTVLPGNPDIYSVVDNRITPALNLIGFIEVSVVVSDGAKSSEPFKLSVLVTPVNDPPEIIDLETTALAYEPGQGPKNISEVFDLEDVDNDYLSLAEIGFMPANYSRLNDELILDMDSSKIRAIYDPEGILFLIGYATLDEYRTAIRSIQYNYQITEDENGNPAPISSGTRTIYFNLHDGQHVSATHERQITMETKVLLDIPNAFTPNGDSANDTWRVQATNKDQLEKAVIRVYDKRGVLLYESIGFDKDWDGLSNGEALPVDTYYYTIDLNLSYMKKTYKGVVTILR